MEGYIAPWKLSLSWRSAGSVAGTFSRLARPDSLQETTRTSKGDKESIAGERRQVDRLRVASNEYVRVAPIFQDAPTLRANVRRYNGIRQESLRPQVLSFQVLDDFSILDVKIIERELRRYAEYVRPGPRGNDLESSCGQPNAGCHAVKAQGEENDQESRHNQGNTRGVLRDQQRTQQAHGGKDQGQEGSEDNEGDRQPKPDS